MATEVAKKRKVRGGHRGFVKKLIGTTNALIENYKEEEKNTLVQRKITLTEKLETLRRLDNEVLDLIVEGEDTDELIENEIEETEGVRAEIQQFILKIEETLKEKQNEPESVTNQTAASASPIPLAVSQPVRARLPRLEVRKFSGKIHEWQEFWDSFESAIHLNGALADVDKFSYLRGLLIEPARSTIAGFSLTSGNYKSAVDLLKQRYGKKTAIQRAHVNDLLNLEPLHSARDTTRVRSMYDFIETKHRALDALGVNEDTYSAFVVPSLLEKLPESLRLTITRGKEHHEWSLTDLLNALGKETELREEYYKKPSTREERPKGNRFPPSTMFTGKEPNCAYCMGGHPHENCKKIKDIKERKKLLVKFGRCFNCVRKGHLARDCRSVITCKSCNGKHHSSLCSGVESPGDLNEAEPQEPPASGGPTGNNLHVQTGGRVALQTAQAQILGKGNVKVRVLFDTASHTSFVTLRVAKSLGLQVLRKEWLAVNTFGQRAVGSNLREVVSVPLTPVGGGKVFYIEAVVVPDISRVQNEHLEIARKDYPHLAQIWLSDVCQNNEQLEIDLLIGADYLWNFQTGNVVRGEVEEPVAIETELGWVVSGPLKHGRVGDGEQEVDVHFVGKGSVELGREGIEENVRKLWELDTLGIKESDEVYEEFVDNISFNGSRYTVKLPWKQDHEALPDNYELSLSRMKSQVRKLRNEPEVLKEYDLVLQEQLKAGVVEKVVPLERSAKVHYIPHLAVIRKEASTTKLRIVYDASAKSTKRGPSLNDCLRKGPSLNPLLFDILLRFREKNVALVGDIEKAFLNIEVDKKDRDSLRFVWLEDPKDPKSQIVVYRFCRVVFGLNASPFLLNATLRHHILKCGKEDPEFVRKMLESFYVDDLVTGESNGSDAYALYEKSRKRMAEGGFRLRKWITNDSVLRERIKKKEESSNDTNMASPSCAEEETYAKQTLALSSDEPSSGVKVLGILWDYENDKFRFNFGKLAEKARKLPATKRNVLSLLASVFDPLGIISPMIVRMKMLFQELCCIGLDWDDHLEGKSKQKWDDWVDDLSKVREISIDRCIYENPKRKVLECYLHGFGDASTKAYCAVVYLVYLTNEGVYPTLLTSRSRVAPLKTLTVPRLELMSARILAQLMDTVKKALECQIKISGTTYWLDSKTALCWIQNRGEWKQFVRHRVNEILRLTDKRNWRHCPGEVNPADIGSRGSLGSTLKNEKLWWYGPPWLSQNEKKWPQKEGNEGEISTPESMTEMKKTTTTMVVGSENTHSVAQIIDLSRYSDLIKAIRVTARVIHFIKQLRSNDKKDERKGWLSRNDLMKAEEEWIKVAQSKLSKQENFQQLLSKFGIVEERGILRCVGRLVNSDLETEARRPVILPKEHRLTELIIDDCHKRVHHGGVRATVTELRSKYWVPKGRQVVKKVIKACLVCKKVEGKPYKTPPTAPLPGFRVREAPAFSKVGVDFAGPLYVKNREGGMKKVYIALFSCCVTRAIHLELVEDLSSEAFRRALRRFAGRRGSPELIVSDNAKTFKATEKALKNLFDHPNVASELQNAKTEWKFNLERAPWWGGFFERMVGSVKRCLRKVLANARLTYDELVTVLVEVEGTLNSRPLTYDYNELDEEVLTPSHLIFGRRIKSLPDENSEDATENESSCSQRFRHLSIRLAHFWNRWRKEYLVSLREFNRTKVSKTDSDTDRTVQVGDVVIVFEENKKRSEWKTAVVESLIKGRDDVVRGANIRVITKGKPARLSRPVQKLYPIEISANPNHLGRNKLAKKVSKNPEPLRRNPSRAAALDSKWKTKSMLDS